MARSRLPAGALKRPVRHVRVEPPDGARGWPWTIPAVAQLIRDGLDLPRALVLVGDNGSGKSTIVEAFAQAYGLNPEGGSTGAMHVTQPDAAPLADAIRLERGAGAARGGYFLRAETMHAFFTYLERSGFASFHHLSHGESFVDLVESRFFTPRGTPRPGLYVLDEPESALSFSTSLTLLGRLADLLAEDPGTQVVLATHSPVLAALPGATILRLDASGYAESPWEDLEMVVGLRTFLADPQRTLERLLG